MPRLHASAIPAFLRILAASLPPSAPHPASALLPLLTATTLGHGDTWLKPCIAHALSPYAPLPPGRAPPPEPSNSPLQDLETHPRRLIVAQLKEALVKSASLIGVPRAIETLLQLDSALDDPRDASRFFVRRGLEEGSVIERREAGRKGLGSVYRAELDGIFQLMHERGLDDLRYLSESTTYGTFLTPHACSESPTTNADPLSHDPRLLPLVTLACLVPQRTAREVTWHLRGAIRRGWARVDVERLQAAVERVCEACGVERVGVGMPRVAVVEVQEEERAVEGELRR